MATTFTSKQKRPLDGSAPRDRAFVLDGHQLTEPKSVQRMDLPNNKQHLFDLWAPLYDCLFLSVFYQATHKRLLEYIELPERPNVLDIGCGTGRLLNCLAAEYPHRRFRVDKGSAWEPLTLDMGRKGARPLQLTERERESFVLSRPFLVLDVLLHNLNGCPANGSDKIAIRPKTRQSSLEPGKLIP